VRNINVGAGEFRLPGFENIDITKVPDVLGGGEVIVADALQYDYTGATSIYAGHFLEHLKELDGPAFIARVFEQAAQGAILAVTVPVAELAARLDPGSLHSVVHGGKRWHGDEHLSQWNSESLQEAFRTAGWRNVREWPECPWISVRTCPWQVCVRGEKP
jgi:predicted SAM-dependent methyltransferase